MKPESLVWGFLQGRDMDPWLARALDRGEVAGVVLFSRNLGDPEEIQELTAELRGRWRGPHPLPIAVDQEGGRVRRISFVPWPAPRRLALAGDPSLTTEVGRLMGQELRALGFNVDFAPVLDLSDTGAPGVIGDRSFGPDPATVVTHASGWIMGMRSSGVSVTGKHYPGHGAASDDSHVRLPVVRLGQEEMRRHMEPFLALAPYLDLVMTAHVLYEALDGVPATYSSTILGTLRYDGVVITDDLEMAGAGTLEPRMRGVEALKAGHHSLLVCSSEEIREEVVAGLHDHWRDLEPLMPGIEKRLSRWFKRLPSGPDHDLADVHARAGALLARLA